MLYPDMIYLWYIQVNLIYHGISWYNPILFGSTCHYPQRRPRLLVNVWAARTRRPWPRSGTCTWHAPGKPSWTGWVMGGHASMCSEHCM